MTTTAQRSPRWATALLWVGLAVLAAIVAVFVLILWVAHGIGRGTPQPNVTAFARSDSVRRADRTTAAWLDGQLAQLNREARWLRPAGPSVHDECSTAPASPAGLGGVSSWITTCSRTQSGYYAYAGGADRIAALERALGSLGWEAFTVTPQSLEADHATQAGSSEATLSVSWISPATPQAVARLLTRYRAVYGGSLRNGAVTVLQAIPPDPSRIMRAVVPPDTNLFVVTLQVAYATSPPSS